MLANIGLLVGCLAFGWLLISIESHLKSIDYKLNASSSDKTDSFDIENHLSSLESDVGLISNSLSSLHQNSFSANIESKLDEIIDELRELNSKK